MKRTLLIAIIALLCAVPGIASDRIDLYTDQAMTQCSLVDGAGLQAVYVFLNGTEPATALQFSAPVPACWVGATWVGDGFPGPRGQNGNTQTGTQVTLFAPGMGECKMPPVFVLTIYVFSSGTAQSCCHMVVTPPTAFPHEPYQLEYIDCSLVTTHPASAGAKVTINPNASCPCNGPVATEQSTWGQVKSLYR